MNRYISYIKNNIFKIVPIVLIGLYCTHTSSCANTTGAPTGGPKDTIPPVITATIPDSNATNVPVHKTSVTLTFDEYVQLKDASKNKLALHLSRRWKEFSLHQPRRSYHRPELPLSSNKPV